MQYSSIVETRGSVPFPEFAGERVYMQPFFKSEGLHPALSHWQPTVDAMLEGVDTDQPMYLMVDQAFVPAGTTHRRPGVHIDGYWYPGVEVSRRIITDLDKLVPPPVEKPKQRRGVKPIPKTPRSWPLPPPMSEPFQGHQGGHLYSPPGGIHGSISGEWRMVGPGGWGISDFAAPEAIILASDVTAARGYTGKYSGPIGDMGDCAHIDTSGMKPVNLEAGLVYAGNVTFLHESTPVLEDCHRTVVRINVPGWTP